MKICLVYLKYELTDMEIKYSILLFCTRMLTDKLLTVIELFQCMQPTFNLVVFIFYL